MSAKAFIELKRDPEWETESIALRQNASQEMAEYVISQKEADLDGRSQYYWFRLSNGDLILGVYPCGDTYFETELDRTI